MDFGHTARQQRRSPGAPLLLFWHRRKKTACSKVIGLP
jgi:hypothetical protein